jgi:uncharacterized membrane protein YfcA
LGSTVVAGGVLLWIILLILLLVAVAAGLLGSLSGLGGGVVIVPVLVIAFQVPFVDAVGASAISVLATSTTTGAAYVQDHLTDLRIGNFLQIATVPGALIGAGLTVYLSKLNLAPVLLLLLGAVLLASIPANVALRHEELPTGVVPDRWSTRFGFEGEYFDQKLGQRVHYQGARTISALEVMFGAGLVSGMLGIGSGVLKVFALDRSLRLPMKVSTATSNFMIGVTVTAGVSVLLVAGYINAVIAAPVAIGTTIGAFGGSRLLPRMSNTTVRWIFLPIVIALAAEVIFRGIAGLGVL